MAHPDKRRGRRFYGTAVAHGEWPVEEILYVHVYVYVHDYVLAGVPGGIL